ncbi:MAG: amino acid ABC transporter permease [Candidatus Bipolaricaulota bacterium]|nr:amino acid ABC transporter permease [Candidatus Bipolaricaulota bacterium]MCX7843836.1 amino acid ABC transporter permease [Candidatus Bipolaricaulota bacterium]MDW8151418.1 amino acid ABC transporter permease [Candidatus Bipolaricaulota bacterium]
MNLVFKWKWLPDLAQGLALTLELTGLSMALGAVLGLALALLRVYAKGPLLPLYGLASAYVHFFRGTPLLVQLMGLYYGLPALGIRLSPFLASLLALTLNTAAYQAEYFRGAIQSVKSGQMLAARAIGLTRLQALRYVILPQALRLVIPPWSNELVYMIKGSAIVYLVGMLDLMGRARTIGTKEFRMFEVLVVTALFYLALILLFTVALRWVENRTRIPGLGVPGRS